MASGRIDGSVTNLSKVFSFYADWSSVGNSSGNYSDVTVKIYVKTTHTANTFDTVGKRNHSITIDGTADSISKRIDCNPWSSNPYLIHEFTKRVYHNADGTKSITISARSNGTASSYGYSSSTSSANDAALSATVSLDSLTRKATLTTAPNFNDGQNPTITYSNPAGEAVTSLQAGIYDSTGYTAYVSYRDISKTGTSYTFQLTTAEKETLMAACQGSNSVTVKFYIKTVIGGVTHLSDPLARTFTINDAKPIVTASVVDTNATTVALTGNSGKLIRYFSNAKATMSAEAQKGAAIDENLYIIRNGDQTGYGTTHTFNNVESDTFTFSAEDDRGNIGTAEVTLPMVDYIKLTCNISDNRPDGNGDVLVSCVGNFFNGSFGAVSNTLTAQCRYQVSGGAWSDWEDMTVAPSGNTYYASANLSGLDYQQTYVFEAKASDKLDEVTDTGSAVKSIPVFHWGENDFAFEVPVDFKAGLGKIDGDLTITGDLRLKGNGNFGNTIYFGDSNYVTLGEPYDDNFTLKATTINLVGTIKHNGTELPTLQYGYWTPALLSSAVTSYTTQNGWYIKMGQNVTIGFFVKATCNSGYNSYGISISGLPFTPMASAAGGGMCSGAYVSGGNTFQCFVAGTGGTITPRVQACNNTSATNLTTSASGCFYPSGGGELTLSGTITYMANS
jgi:hypothetical protein